MDSSLKGLILAAGIIITCIVISLGFYISRQSKDTAYSGVDQINKLNAEFTESDKTMYEGISIAGSEVINVINKFKSEEISVVVTTKSNNTTYYGYSVSGTGGKYVLGSITSNSTQTAKKVSNACYIKPTAQFLGTILRDSNDAIIGIHFTQQ